MFQVTVFEKSTRNGTRLYAETQCSDPLHFMLQFIIRDATDFDGLLSRFLAELEHRGFDAGRYRLRLDGRWGDWMGLSGVAQQGSSGDRRRKAGSVSEG
ncbi:MAG: hypothetical protein GXP54_07805 [Deltaproteobacteria bacterium]|nr:hypothetical protein [Deltaproteobacteria bacterium]